MLWLQPAQESLEELPCFVNTARAPVGDPVDPVTEDGLEVEAGAVPPWRWQAFDVHDLAAEINTAITDVDPRAGDQPRDLCLAPPTERALTELSALPELRHPCLPSCA